MARMNRPIRVLSGTVAMLLGATSIDAQVCTGQTDIAASSRLVSAAAAGSDLGRTVVGRYAISRDELFGGVQAGTAGVEFKSATAPIVGGDIGYVVRLGASGATQLCPRAQILYQRGPNRGDYTNSSVTSSVGLALGRSIGVTGGFAFVPYVHAGVAQFHRAFGFSNGLYNPNDASAPTVGYWGQTNALYGEMGVGIGFRFNNVMTITPSYRMPLSYDRGSAMEQQTYSVSASFRFRK